MLQGKEVQEKSGLQTGADPGIYKRGAGGGGGARYFTIFGGAFDAENYTLKI